jgi:xylan 1,4-beta-xylosidase
MRNLCTAKWLLIIFCISGWEFDPAYGLVAQENISATVPTGVPPAGVVDALAAVKLQADAHAQGKPLVHYWSRVVGAGRANEGLRASWQEQLHEVVQADGFQSVRFHGLFHDDMFMYHLDKQGQPIYNFQYVDDLFDRMLQNGARPFVELGFVPEALASGPETSMWWRAHGTPPNDYGKWDALVDHFVRHCIARYGAEEVRRWHFEVWNEPNLHSFFSGTQQQYFDLYRVTAKTIKSIDPALKVGGPATSNFELAGASPHSEPGSIAEDGTGGNWRPVWVEEFLKYCHAQGVPVDFVSTHPYPTNFAMEIDGTKKILRRSINSTHDDLATLRNIVKQSAYPDAEIQLTEWSSSPFSRDHTHDALPAAAFIVKTNLDSAGLADSLSYWTFTDILEESREIDSIFHGGFGLMNYQGIAKPAFHAYRFLHALGDETIASTDGCIVTRDSKTGKIVVLGYNYPLPITIPVTMTLADADSLTQTGVMRPLILRITGLPPGAAFLIETLDRAHGNVVRDWEKMGKPEPPTREQTELLRKLAWNTTKETVNADDHGTLEIHRPMDAWSVVLFKQID